MPAARAVGALREDADELYDNAPCGYLSTLPDGAITRVNRTFLNWTGHRADELVGGRRFEELLSPGARIFHATHFAPLLAMQGHVNEIALDVRRKDGTVMPALVNARVVRNARGTPALHRIVVFNASERRAYERELVAARAEAERMRERLETVLESTSDSIVVLDPDWRVGFANGRAASVLRRRDLPGLSAWEAFPGSAGSPLEAALRRAQESRRATELEHEIAALGVWLEIHAFPSPDGLVVFFRDISERRRLEEARRRDQERIVYMARHDGLTGLPNRVLFGERLEQAFAQTRRGVRFALHCLDLDGFKGVNDTHGHAAGDALLQGVAQRLQACVREVDTVARLGGDEFAVIQTAVTRAEEVGSLAQRLIDVLAEPFSIEGRRVQIGTSVGIAVAPDLGADAATLIRHADIALYRAKKSGRGRFCAFAPEMSARLRARQAMQQDLVRALQAGQFELLYQPFVAVQSGRVVGHEAFLRWNHPTRGTIGPDEFIPVAEDGPLITAVGAWAIERACADAALWPGIGRVAVNLSPLQFRGIDSVDIVRRALATSRLRPDRLELDIKESVLLQDDARALEALTELRGLGVRITLDDFGTGFSSLGRLRRFRFDKIKIDSSFVRELPAAGECAAIIEAILALGRSLDIVTAAEGVETPLQRDWLRRAGCREAQGYLFGRPDRLASLRRLRSRLPAPAQRTGRDDRQPARHGPARPIGHAGSVPR